MSIPWNSLYCPSENADAIIQSLRESMAALGYEAYNPFGSFPGKSYQLTVRLFVAPSSGGWTKVIGTPDEGQLASLSRLCTCLYLQLDGTQSHITVYADGAPVEVRAGLLAYLRDGCSPADLEIAADSTRPTGEDDAGKPSTVFDMLPDDIQGLAGRVDSRAAEQMFNRLSGQLMKKVGGTADAAQAFMSGEGAPDWGSTGGKRIRALMKCLTIPDGWDEPDVAALRDAYALHERRRRNPQARLYPGDEAIMAGVTDALAYTPIYGGRNS